jgi:hypothetical protein
MNTIVKWLMVVGALSVGLVGLAMTLCGGLYSWVLLRTGDTGVVLSLLLAVLGILLFLLGFKLIRFAEDKYDERS